MHELRYSPDQPRDDHGRFGETGTASEMKDSNYDKDSAQIKKTLQAWQDDYSSNNFERVSDEAASAAIAGGDKAANNPIVNGIRNETFKGTIYRGLAIKKTDDIAQWREGQTVQLLPQSFSRNEQTALDFAAAKQAKLDLDPRIRVCVQVSSGNGISIGDRGMFVYRDEKEVITGGQFKVLSIARVADAFNIKLKQTGVF